MKRRASQSGFTLLEVLIAAVLVGSVFVAVVSLMSQSLRNIDRMRPHETAMLHARERMNEQLLRDELQPETTSGQWSDGYRWSVEIAPLDFMVLGQSTATPTPVPYSPSDPSANATVRPGTKTLFRVKVRIAWGGRDNAHTYDLETMQWAQWPVPKS
jgi:type II secretion system protein I